MRRIIFAALAIIILLSATTPAKADETLLVYYAGDENSGVYSALELTGYTLVTDPAMADVYVLNGEIPSNPVIRERIKSGDAGLVLILGESMTESQAQELLGVPVVFEEKENAVSLTGPFRGKRPASDGNNLEQCATNSRPQECVYSLSSVQPLVIGYADGEWILWQYRPKAFIFNGFLGNEVNPQIQDWSYFNYLIYHLATRAGGETPQSFADYPASPVPHTQERNLLWGLMAVILVTTFSIFFFVRRYSLAHPEELDRIVADRTTFRDARSGNGMGRRRLSSTVRVDSWLHFPSGFFCSSRSSFTRT